MLNASQISQELIRYARRSRFNPIRTLTPELLAQHLDSFATGTLQPFALAAQAIKKRDDVISVALPKREKAVSRRSHAIHLLEGIGAESSLKARAEEHRAALQYFFENLTAVNALDQNERGGFRRLVRQMMEAVGYRYAVHEIVWQPRIVEGQARLTAQFNYVPLQFFENTTGKLRFLQQLFGGVEGVEMPDDQWLVTVGDGIMEPLSVAWMFKQLSLKDWVSFNELLGTPIRLGTTSAPKDSDAWKVLVEALEGIGQDFAAVVNEGSKIEFISANKSGGETFGPLVDRMDRAIATICRGADLSTMSAGQGSGQGASLQGDESDLLEEDDAAMISEHLEQVSRIVIRELFGAEEQPLAYLEIVVPKRKNNDDTRKSIELLTARGVAVGQSWARAELGVPEPAEGEAVLTAPATPAAPFNPAAAFANAAEAAINDAAFRTRSLREIAAAKAKAFEPLRARIAEIAGIEDAAAQDAALLKLKADLPRYAKQAGMTEEEVTAWINALGAKLVSGAVEAAQGQGTLAAANSYEEQPRDDLGRWTDTGGGGMTWKTAKGTEVSLVNGTVEMRGQKINTAFDITKIETNKAGLLHPAGRPEDTFSADNRDRLDEMVKRTAAHRAKMAALGLTDSSGRHLAILSNEERYAHKTKSEFRALEVDPTKIRAITIDGQTANILPITQETCSKRRVETDRVARLNAAATQAEAKRHAAGYEQYERGPLGQQMRRWNA